MERHLEKDPRATLDRSRLYLVSRLAGSKIFVALFIGERTKRGYDAFRSIPLSRIVASIFSFYHVCFSRDSLIKLALAEER